MNAYEKEKYNKLITEVKTLKAQMEQVLQEQRRINQYMKDEFKAVIVRMIQEKIEIDLPAKSSDEQLRELLTT